MEQQADPILERAVRGAIRDGVRALGWACRYLPRLVLARPIIALLVIAASLTIAVYALWIGAILWLVTGRFGIVKLQRRRPQMEATVAALAIAALIAQCASGGRSPLNLAVITICALGGALVWFERHATLEALRTELRKGHD
jgi:hypothetical protein